MKRKWLAIALCTACAALLFSAPPVLAQGTKQYVVTALLAPVFENLKTAKPAPKGG